MKLIDEARQAWRMASVQLAAAAAILAGVLTANPHLALGLIAFIPPGPLRYLLAAGVGLVVFALPTIARLWHQPKVKGKSDGPR